MITKNLNSVVFKIIVFGTILIFEVVLIFSLFYTPLVVKQSVVDNEIIDSKITEAYKTYKSDKFGYEFQHPEALSINDLLGTTEYDNDKLLLEMYLDYVQGSSSLKSMCRSVISISKSGKSIEQTIDALNEDGIEDIEIDKNEGYIELSYEYKDKIKEGKENFVKVRFIKHLNNLDYYYFTIRLHYLYGDDSCEVVVNPKSKDDYIDAYNIIVNSLKLYPDNSILTDKSNWLSYSSEELGISFKYPDMQKTGFKGWYVGNSVSVNNNIPSPSDPKVLSVCREHNCMRFGIAIDDTSVDETDIVSFDKFINTIETNNYIELGDTKLSIITTEEVNIDNQKAYKIVVDTKSLDYGRSFTNGPNTAYVFFPHNEKILMAIYDSENLIFEKIVNTVIFE